MKLWDRKGSDEGIETMVEEFTASEDVKLDEKLIRVDILGGIAHTQMLYEQGYLSEDEVKDVHAFLLEIYESSEQVEITPEDEDVHTTIENLVTERTEAGKKVHTGRSRNDQILVDTRLYSKENLIELALKVTDLVEALVKKGEEYKEVVMPGYTHLRQAMPMTAQLWLQSFAESLMDDLKLLDSAFELNDQNPLGAAAGYGTTLDIDREKTAKLLGFSKVQPNPLYSISSRGKVELQVVSTLSQILLDLDRLANDLILFSTSEFGFVKLPEEFCTGSSIMPQKSNPDVLEVLKGKVGEVIGNQHQIELILKGSNSGYNRDTQETKGALLKSVKTTKECLKILTKLIQKIDFDQEKIEEEVEEGIYATYTANQLVEEGLPFREAYRKVKKEGNYLKPDPEDFKTEDFDYDTLEGVKNVWKDRKESFGNTVEKLLEMARENS